jgi:D-beta-D-heptose 7-phosphate kinase/D-beta-D-heptose 1-phosphate adenosyltransferase
MARVDAERLIGIVERMADVRLLVVGDVVLDEYVSGEVERVSPEAPVPVVQVRDESFALGGAANVARNITALGAGVDVCAVVGDDEAGDRLTALLDALRVDASNLVVAKGRPTTRKTRVVARSQQVARLDREASEPLPVDVAQRVAALARRAAGGADGVVVEDYGKGLLSQEFATELMRDFRAAGLPVVVDPKGTLAPYRDASVLKPNLREAEALSGVQIRDERSLAAAAARLRRDLGDGALVVTLGADGMVLFASGAEGVRVPTVSQEVFDVQGAGDTTAAALALSLRAGATLFEAAVIANAAAGVVVGKVGTATASASEVCELIPRALAAAGGSR